MLNHELTKRLNLWAKSNPRLLARHGLCFHMEHILGAPVLYFDHVALEKHYKYYSGDALFPVSSPLSEYNAGTIFRHNWENLYLNEYGNRRLNLLASLATAEVYELAGAVKVVITGSPVQPVLPCTVVHGSQNILFYDINEQGIDYVHNIIEDFQEIKP